MAQSDQVVQNATFPSVRADINDNLAALYSQSSGNSAPTVTVAFQPWIDTSSSPPTWKVRNGSNSAWITIGILDPAQFQVSGLISGVNTIINGNPIINQRSYISGTATAAANQYTLDRWRVVTSGQSITWTDSGNVRTVTAPAGGVEQVIEGINLITGTYTLNWTGTASATVAGTSVAKGGNVSITGGTDTTVRFSSGTFSLVQFESGTAVTPFERRSYGQELALCQRYYHQTSQPNDFYGRAGTVAATAYHAIIHEFPVIMRIAPNYSAAAATFTSANASAFSNTTTPRRHLTLISLSNTPDLDAYFFLATGSLTWSAEL
jgi:hypothetical protein